jgi:hypothetical protein
MPCGAWSEMDPAMRGSAWMGAQLMRGALESLKSAARVVAPPDWDCRPVGQG